MEILLKTIGRMCFAAAGLMLATNATAQEATGTVIASSNDINHVYITTTRVENGGKAGVPGHAWVKDMNVVSDEDWFKIKPNRLDDTTPWQLVRENGKTVLHCYLTQGDNIWRANQEVTDFQDSLVNLWLGGDETSITDMETGIHYKARGTYDNSLWNTHFDIIGRRHRILDFPIEFPELPKSTKRIRITGVPSWNLRGGTTIILSTDEQFQYDEKPTFHIPQLVETEKPDYNPDDMDTYAVYAGAHTIKPRMKDKEMALWRTKDATYLAVAFELNWNQEYFSFSRRITLKDRMTGIEYPIRKIQGIPLDHLFMLKGHVGDCVAFIMEFPPLPLETYRLNYYEPEGEPFSAWGANWSATDIRDLYVQQLKDNQKQFEYVETEVVE